MKKKLEKMRKKIKSLANKIYRCKGPEDDTRKVELVTEIVKLRDELERLKGEQLLQELCRYIVTNRHRPSGRIRRAKK